MPTDKCKRDAYISLGSSGTWPAKIQYADMVRLLQFQHFLYYYLFHFR
jgi:hypothetical protein